MLSIIDPIHHRVHQSKIESLLSLFKIYQAFELPLKVHSQATFIVAEDEVRGIYGGAIFFPQKVRELNTNLSDILSLLGNRIVWCVRLCYCASENDNFSTRDSIERREHFYMSLYEALSLLGKQKDTNCLPLTLLRKDYRDSITYGQWDYLAEVHPQKSLPNYVHALLSLPEKRTCSQDDQEKCTHKGERCRTISSPPQNRPTRRSVR